MAKAIISTTYSNTYLYFLPIVTFCWNKLGVDVICFFPSNNDDTDIMLHHVNNTMNDLGMRFDLLPFNAPKHKEATYAQCARLYGACLDLPEDEVLIISDIDMANFKIPPHENGITIWGSDLVPEQQFPMCYASGTVKEWRSAMKLQYGALSADPKDSAAKVLTFTYQECLDKLLGEIECEHMRGNYWGKDQQTLWENTFDKAILIPRARPNTQFASNRVDRDDINWRAYVNDELVDAHLWRNGFDDGNFANILELLTMKFPNDDFAWLINYTNQYKALL